MGQDKAHTEKYLSITLEADVLIAHLLEVVPAQRSFIVSYFYEVTYRPRFGRKKLLW